MTCAAVFKEKCEIHSTMNIFTTVSKVTGKVLLG